MKIIVTGGAGFIGGNFVHHMVNKYPEYQIINLDLLTYAGNLETLKPVEDKPNYKFVHGDIADRDFVFKLCSGEPRRPFHHGPGGVCPYQCHGNDHLAGCLPHLWNQTLSSGIDR